jgi:hypothetical protein
VQLATDFVFSTHIAFLPHPSASLQMKKQEFSKRRIRIRTAIMAQLRYYPVVRQSFWEIPMAMKHNDTYKRQISLVFKEMSVKAICGPLQLLNGGYCPMPAVIK